MARHLLTVASTVIAVGLFEREADAQDAVRSLSEPDVGLGEANVGLLKPHTDSSTGDVTGLLAAASGAGDVRGVLVSLGVPEGEARFYSLEVESGRTLVVVNADSEANYDAAREAILRKGGYDVRSRGDALASAEGSGVPGGTGPRPIDVTGEWTDVASRYEMLWEQHYGTSDATWEQVWPVYRFAWQMANDARYRGRPWAEVETAVRREWESSSPSHDPSAEPAPTAGAWEDVVGAFRDVWEDVAEEAAMGAEGGGDRRIPRQGTDQQVAARDLRLR